MIDTTSLNRLPVRLLRAFAAFVAGTVFTGVNSPAFAANSSPEVGGPAAVWRDPARKPDERARDILPRLTLEEKISLVHADGTFTTPGLPRFGSRKLWMSDGPNGVREEIQPTSWNSANHSDDFATALPADIGIAATFDVSLGTAGGNVIGEEARARGKNIMLCPGLNIMRTPLNGRNSEYLGEDPFLASRMAVGFVEALQSHGVAACAKHFACNNQEINRNSVNVHVDERTLREIYLPAFKAAVTEAHVWSVMTAYNRVNGQYCSENEFLLNQVLKKDWKFQGLAMTDWGGCHSTVNAANHGLDLEMGSNVPGDARAHARDFLGNPLLQAVSAEKPQVPLSRLDDMVLRNLRVMFATGCFDPLPDSAKNVPLMSPEHIDAARQIEESAIVLLKNADNLLPLDRAKTKSIAVIGDNAQAKFAHDGNSAAIKTRYEVTPLDGIRKFVGSDVSIAFARGYARTGGRGRGAAGGAAAGNSGGAAALIDEAVAAANSADVAIVVAGLYRSQDQEGDDRRGFNLPQGQAEVISAVCKANPRTVVVLTGGSPSSVDPWLANCGALLMYWYGGTEGGNALARILFGEVSPSGHLPCTWPKQLSDSPAHSTGNVVNYPGTGGRGGRGNVTADSGPQEEYNEGILVGYRWFDAKNIEPQFPFGFGLSYTTFEFSRLSVSAAPADNRPVPVPLRGFAAMVVATVTNTGPRDGAEAVQVYVQPAEPSLPRPPRELKAFMKKMVVKGHAVTMMIPLDLSAFAYFDPAEHAWIAEPGEYTILVGDSSRHLPLQTTFKLTEKTVVKEGL